jgi:DNA primase
MDAKVPMFEFVIRQMLGNYNLDTVEGRVAALREAAPVVADIRDAALRPGYTRELARLTGVDVSEAQVAVSNAVKASRSKGMQTTSEGARQGYAGAPTARPAGAPGEQASAGANPVEEPTGPRVFELKNDPSTRLERDALMALIQFPELVGPDLAADATQAAIMDSNLATIRDAIGANLTQLGGETWLDRIQADLPQDFKPLLTQLAVAPLPQHGADHTEIYCRGVVISLIERDLVRRKSELVGRLQRTSVDQGEVSREIQRELLDLETKRRSLRQD